jgi:hypothetical protein
MTFTEKVLLDLKSLGDIGIDTKKAITYVNNNDIEEYNNMSIEECSDLIQSLAQVA